MWSVLENDLLRLVLFPHYLLTLDCKPLIKRAISAIVKQKGLLPYIEAVLLTMEFKTLWESEKELTKDFDNQLVQTIDSQCESLGVGFLFPEIQRQKCLRRTEGIQISSQRQIWKKKDGYRERQRAKWSRQYSRSTECGQECETESNRMTKRVSSEHVAMRSPENTGALCGRMSLL